MSGRDLSRNLSLALRRAIQGLRALREPPAELTVALVPAAVAAFLLLNILDRAGSAVPRGPITDALFLLSFAVGIVAYNAAILLAAIVVALTAWCARKRDAVVAALTLAILLSVVVSPIAGSTPIQAAVRTSILAAIVAVLGLRALASKPRGPTPTSAGGWALHLAPWPFTASVTGTYALLAGAFIATAASLPAAPGLQGGAELLAVAAALAAPWVLASNLRPIPLVLAAVGGLAVLVLGLRSAILPLVAKWAVSFQMYLPLAAYVLGATALVYALADRLSRERLRGRAASLILLVVAGIGMNSTYEVLLVTVGALRLFGMRPRSGK